MTTTHSETDLLARARRFDCQALAEIYDRYSPALYAYSLRLLGDPQAAEDCVAETFSRLLRSLKAGNGPQDYLQAYLYRIAHNWITDQYRRQPVLPIELQEQMPVPNSVHTEQTVDENIRRQQVRQALCHLTPEQRQVVVLKYIEGWENEDVAAALQKPIGAIKALQHRAVQTLKRMLLKGYESSHETI